MNIGFTCFLLLVLACGKITNAAFLQADEHLYLQNFDSIMGGSYSAVDDDLDSKSHGNPPPSELILNCKKQQHENDLPPPTFAEILITAQNDDTPVVLASSISTRCTPEAICIIAKDTTLSMDTNLNVGALIVRGKVEWNDETQTSIDQYLCGGYIVLEQNGAFDMNLSQKNGWIYIKDNGAVHNQLRSRVFGAYAAINSPEHPTISVTGRNLPRTWSLLAEPLKSGQIEMKLLHHPSRMNWLVGDRLGVAPTKARSTGWGQTFRISAIDDDGTIQLSDPAEHDYKADYEAPSKKVITGGRNDAGAALKSAEVVNLSRNIIITGDDFAHVPCDPNLPEAVMGEQTSVQGCRCSSFRTKCTVGLHTIQANGGVCRIQNVRVEKCGQRGIEGKYCMHFHKLKECPDCLFKNNAIEGGQQRGIIIHGTHLSNIEGNVLYNVRGAGIYIEDGNEMWNHIAYNTVICPFPFEDMTYHGCTVPGTSNLLSDTKDNQSSFYGHAGSNNLVGNRAANSFNGMFLKEGGRGRGSTYDKVCESAARLGRYEGNTFHGHGRFGTYALGFNYPKVTDQSPENNGFNTDKDLCQGFDNDGNTRGLPGSFVYHVDYGNAFVGHYSAGDLQYHGHHSTDSNNLIYWKETKNFQNGCASHIVNGHYERGRLALPDMATFIIENTFLGEDVMLEANHHCNVGTTGFLCMPQYILEGVHAQQQQTTSRVEFQYFNTQDHSANQHHGGIFSLSPLDALVVMNGGEIPDSFFPAGFVSLVSDKFSYLLGASNTKCSHSAANYGNLYSNGILCKVPLRSLKVYSRGLVSYSAPKLRVEVWFNSFGIGDQVGREPDSVQEIGFHQIGSDYESNKQGYSVPVIPGTDQSYRISLVENGLVTALPNDWIIEFNDPVMGNRWGEEVIYLTVMGRDCGNQGLISSQHDRKYIYSGDVFLADEAWGRHGACVGIGPQPPKTALVNCNDDDPNRSTTIDATNCPELCLTICENQNAYCDCGTGTCRCKAGFAGANCEVDLCGAARCGEHGTCSAKFLGSSAILPVTSSEKACICDDGWTGPLCDRNPCLETGKTCSSNGQCTALGPNIAICKCNPGYSGDNCENSCFGICPGVFPFGCASDVEGKVALGCDVNGGCSYLDPGQDYPYNGFCTYKTYGVGDGSSSTVCDCIPENDCVEIVGPCHDDGTCPDPVARQDGTACNSVPWGICISGKCAEPDNGSIPPIPTSPPTSRCGCQSSCSDDVWNSDADGHTCGNRIEWLQSLDAVIVGGPYTELDACLKVGGEEFSEICGQCNPEQCGATPEPTLAPTTPDPTPEPTDRPTPEPTLEPTGVPTLGPTPEPSPEPTPVPSSAVVISPKCGCQSSSSCSDEVWNRNANGHTCGDRIEWLQTLDAAINNVDGRPYTEVEACLKIGAEEYPEICGPCNPNNCNNHQNHHDYYCGIATCTQAIWNRNANGHTCGDRIEWLQTTTSAATATTSSAVGPFDEKEACRKVSVEYPEECGLCNPTINKCGVSTCTTLIWNKDADGYTCGERIEWLLLTSELDNNQNDDELEACRKISVEEYPNICGLCNPDTDSARKSRMILASSTSSSTIPVVGGPDNGNRRQESHLRKRGSP